MYVYVYAHAHAHARNKAVSGRGLVLDDVALAVAVVKARERQEATHRQASVLSRVESDFLAFLTELVYVHDPPPGLGFIKWEPWPHLEELANTITSTPHLVILKSRQLGLSWFFAAYALWTAMFKPGALVLMLSQGEDEAKELLGKVRKIHSQLPEGIRPKVIKDIEEQLSVQSQGGGVDSTIMALPSTTKAGSGYTATLVICDEHAKHPYAATNFAALEPTINAGAQFISVSTARGPGNYFHSLYQNAKAKLSTFNPLFFHAQLRPGRDDAWYESTKKSYVGDSAHLFYENYPRSDTEAFVTTVGLAVFDKDAMERLVGGIKAPISIKKERYGEIAYYQMPVPGRQYVCGSDVSYGLSAPDKAVSQILDWRTGYLVASLYGNFPPDQLMDATTDLCVEYNDALLGFEENGIGQLAERRLQDIGYQNVYFRDWEEARGKGVRPSKMGWHTGANRHLMVSELSEAVRTGELDVVDEGTVGEMRTFVFRWGKPQAAEGCHDDRVMALAIAWQMRQSPYVFPSSSGRIRTRRFIGER